MSEKRLSGKKLSEKRLSGKRLSGKRLSEKRLSGKRLSGKRSKTMSLSIGRVAKIFGLSPETLRYYEREGFLAPEKNHGNGYREYTLEDLLLLTDLLFYRDIGIPIKDIHGIFDGMAAEEVTDLIGDKKLEIREKIARLKDSLTKLENWEQLHSESLKYLGKYDIRPMPLALRPRLTVAPAMEAVKTMESLQKYAYSHSSLAFFLTFSFFCDLAAEERPSLLRYIALDKSVAKNLPFSFQSADLEEETFPRCLFTVVKFQEDAQAMLSPLLTYAKEQGLRLSGQIYGRQSINTYNGDAFQEYYRVYGVLED